MIGMDWRKGNKKILFVTHASCGGAEHITVRYASILRNAGYDSRLLVFQDPRGSFDLEPLIPEELPLNLVKARYRSIPFRTIAVLKRLKPDCVFYCGPFLVPVLLVAKLFRRGLKVVIRECNSPSSHTRLEAWPVVGILGFADGIIAQTDRMRREMSEFYYVPERKIEVITNPIDKTLINRLAVERRDDIPSGSPRFVAVGRVSRQKDYITMLSAFRWVLRPYPGAVLEIVGPYYDTGYFEELKEFIRINEIEGLIAFHGLCSNPYKYMASADVFVNSSTYEGCPNALLEAASLGVPVVATRSFGSIGKIVREGINGFTTEVGDSEALGKAMIDALTLDRCHTELPDSTSQIIRFFRNLLG